VARPILVTRYSPQPAPLDLPADRLFRKLPLTCAIRPLDFNWHSPVGWCCRNRLSSLELPGRLAARFSLYAREGRASPHAHPQPSLGYQIAIRRGPADRGDPSIGTRRFLMTIAPVPGPARTELAILI